MRKFLIILSDLILVLLLAYTLFQVPLTVYGLGQARGQFLILWKAESITKLKAEEKFNEAERSRLDVIESVKKYSVDSLFYEPSDNYTKYYDQKGRSLLWIVTGCAPYAFEEYEWKFPYLGKVSYKGYFDSLKAVKELIRLKGEGFDADLGRVNAWSTLGWFRDPVFSEMLKKQKGELANLIFHELFHGTIYAPNAVELNENLANFIAHRATLRFLKMDTAELKIYERSHAAEKRYDRFIFSCIRRLDSLYAVFKDQDIPEKERRIKKLGLLVRFTRELEKEDFFSGKKPERLSRRILHSANAYFTHFTRYDGLEDSLENVLQKKYKGDLGQMIRAMKAEIKSL